MSPQLLFARAAAAMMEGAIAMSLLDPNILEVVVHIEYRFKDGRRETGKVIYIDPQNGLS